VEQWGDFTGNSRGWVDHAVGLDLGDANRNSSCAWQRLQATEAGGNRKPPLTGSAW